MAELKVLITERGHIKSRLTRLKTYFTSISADETSVDARMIAQLNERFVNAESLLTLYEKTHLDITRIDDSGSHEADLETFENSYYDTIPEIKLFLAKHKAPEVKGAPPSANYYAPNLESLPLPPIDLPHFSGQFEHWDEFHDAFDSIIDKNPRLPDIQKFRYLISVVEGDAAQALKSLKVTAENYPVALNVLKKRFENKKLIVRSNLEALFEIEFIKKESHFTLQRLLDDIIKIVESLKNYQQPTVDTLLIYIISVKLSANARQEWELHKAQGEFPTFQEFTNFLEGRCQVLGSMQRNATLFGGNYNDKLKIKNDQSKAHVSTEIKAPGCVYCKGNHAIYSCEGFIKLSINSRIATARRFHLCLNCLKRNHATKNCTLQNCQKCGKKHNTLLHLEFNVNPDPNQLGNSNIARIADEPVAAIENAEPQQASTSLSHACNLGASQILLSTACVQITDTHGNKHTCRCLLDPGSQSSFITTDLCNRLGVEKQNHNLIITGVSQLSSRAKYKTVVNIQSRINNYRANVACHILDKITEHLPTVSFNLSELNIPATIKLADPKCNVSQRVDMLLGANCFWELLCNGQHSLGKNMPILQKTQLGWIIGGTFTQNKCQNSTNKTLAHLNVTSLQGQLEKFWTLEECQAENPYANYSSEEKFCENHFLKTHKRADAFPHRFIVSIPLKGSVSELGNSKELAMKRFYALERKLERDPKLKAEYTSFLDEYQRLGHMTQVDDNYITQNPKYYLPHHAVLKETSSTTKVRVVFDASMKTALSGATISGPSLNEIQCVGPTIQDDMFAILCRFRKHEFVMSADIAKMYRQILIDNGQRNLQLILWRPNNSQPLKSYQLNTVTYGTAAASFLAIRCLKQLAIECRDKHPIAARIIENDFYVDDLLTGFDSKEMAIKAQCEISEVLGEGGFELRKWASNDKSILGNIKSIDNLEQGLIEISDNVGTLGVLWNPSADKLQYSSRDFTQQIQVTKRTILSCIAQIFDPLGLLGPIIVTAKMIIQRLWQLKLSWDESIPLDLHTKFLQFRDKLYVIHKLNIPRHVICKGPIVIELHGFCDASEGAYGACIYIRSINKLGSCHVSLLCAKSRVAPLKNVSLPRLELCGALLLANLSYKVKESLNMEFSKLCYWCDSTVTLSWIKSAPNKWKTFVANRVSEIQRLTDSNDWRHVSTQQNPADLISRGLELAQLENSLLWWNGPEFLADRDLDCYHEQTLNCIENIAEARVVVNLAVQPNNGELFQRYSSIWKLQRVIAYCLRFVNNARSNSKRPSRVALSNSELKIALALLLKLAQREVFFAEISSLTEGKGIKSNSSLLSLNPFMDEQGLMRVGGRIQQSNFGYNKKHPIILPSAHTLTKLIVKAEHLRLMHCGANLLLASLREQYWPISGRSVVKKIIHECITCFKAKPKPMQYIMGSLPRDRLVPAPPFYNCGVDFAGPVMIKNKRGRGCKLIKSYISIFVCFVTKAVHIELVVDLSTNEFLAALRRFVSRRGMPLNIYSDNGTNFVGANKQLKELQNFLDNEENQNKLIEASTKEGISWHFIPSRSPHFGGLWEAGVKSMKFHLQRIVGNAHLTFDELYTLLVQIEAILNSRPLCPLSNDPNDNESLTPSHFLIGRPLKLVPEPSLAKIAENRLNKYQHLQKVMQHFWKRWSVEYVGELQTRTKWKREYHTSLEIGKLAIIRDDNLPPLKWQLGRIVDLHPGPDGIPRVVSIRTNSGTVLKRGVIKICVLPTD